MRVGHVRKSGQDECVGQEDNTALGPPGERTVGGKGARGRGLRTCSSLLGIKRNYFVMRNLCFGKLFLSFVIYSCSL